MAGIMDLIWPGAFVIQSIHMVARLGIADLLGPEPRSTDDFAEVAQAPPNEPDPSKFLDVWFIGGGGERTEVEFRALLRRAGFALARVVPTGEPSAILESRSA